MCDGLLENRIDCEGNWITPTYSVVKFAIDNYNENLNGSKHESNSNLNVQKLNMDGEMDGPGHHLLSIQEPVFRIEKKLVNTVVGTKKKKLKQIQSGSNPCYSPTNTHHFY